MKNALPGSRFLVKFFIRNALNAVNFCKDCGDSGECGENNYFTAFLTKIHRIDFCGKLL